MGGIEATRTLRDMGGNCKILAVTASYEPIVKERFIEGGEITKSTAFEVESSNSKEVTGKMNADKVALIVDDDSFIRIYNTAVLRQFGFKNFTAENRKQAVLQSGAHFDLITMDFQMTIMDGIEATKTLRDVEVDCMILAVTGSNKLTVKERFIEAGVDHFFTKPLNAEKVASSLKNM
ncbi:Two-component response regulator ARR22 [Heracleum sosnowskyi]|uniref:Two-component response regulator ARR22 n=1 Tax=Heracleum sosnowskyi TaxID=360622 RepID=A0AAD8JF58_9APIA|nr:Two-component response regulator ARR22 [Heracleum sosnowskyi]